MAVGKMRQSPFLLHTSYGQTFLNHISEGMMQEACLWLKALIKVVAESPNQTGGCVGPGRLLQTAAPARYLH
jgi:hypothetical protein